jgi:hypothetical protein
MRILVDVPGAISVVGTISGNYVDTNGVNHGFLRAPDGTITTFAVPEAGTGSFQGTVPEAANPRTSRRENREIGVFRDLVLLKL